MTRTSARPKLVEPDGFATAARANLALEIAARRAADETLRQLDGAELPLREAVFAARGAVGDAERALEQARAAASEHLLATACGTAGNAPVTIKAARAGLQEAEDGLATAVAARDGLAARLTEAQAQSAKAAERTKHAALAVLFESPAMTKIAEDVARLQAELVDRAAAFMWLAKAGAWPAVQEHGHRFGRLADERLRDTMSQLHSPPTYWQTIIAAVPGQRPWEEALAGLMLDATAAVPADAA